MPKKGKTSKHPLSNRRGREVWDALVELQDAGHEVNFSRSCVAVKYEVTVDVIGEIERQGLAEDWPLPAL